MISDVLKPNVYERFEEKTGISPEVVANIVVSEFRAYLSRQRLDSPVCSYAELNSTGMEFVLCDRAVKSYGKDRDFMRAFDGLPASGRRYQLYLLMRRWLAEDIREKFKDVSLEQPLEDFFNETEVVLASRPMPSPTRQ